MPIVSKFPMGGKIDPDPVTNGNTVEVIARDKIKVGDTVYTVTETCREIEGDIQFPEFAYEVCAAAISLDGSMLLLAESTNVKVFSVDNTTISYLKTMNFNFPVKSLTFSNSGSSLVITGGMFFAGFAKLYSVSGMTIAYEGDIYADNSNTHFDGAVCCSAFSKYDTALVLGGGFTGGAKIYSLAGSPAVYYSDISGKSDELDGAVYAAEFGYYDYEEYLIIGGSFTGYAKAYSIHEYTAAYISDLYSDSKSTALTNTVLDIAFFPDGGRFVIGGRFSDYAKLYLTDSMGYAGDIYANNGNTKLNGSVNSIAFSLDGTRMVLGGEFSGNAKAYTVSDGICTYVSDVPIGKNGESYGTVMAMQFSPDGTVLVIGGDFQGKANFCSVSGDAITYENVIYTGEGSRSLCGKINTAAFSPNGKTLIMGGKFSGGAKVFSVDGTLITYQNDIPADADGNPIVGEVTAAAFSPSGDVLVLGCGATGGVRVYSVDGTNMTYINSLQRNAGDELDDTALLNVPKIILFSPDGGTLFLSIDPDIDAEYCFGYALIFSVDGTNITYVRELYAGSGTEIFTGMGVNLLSAAFSPDGNIFVVGMNQTTPEQASRGLVYSVDGTDISYVNDFYINENDNGIMAISFSPDGETMVVGGRFKLGDDAGADAESNAMVAVYSVNGTDISYSTKLPVDSIVSALSFSPDGSMLVVGKEYASESTGDVFSVYNESFTHTQNIYKDGNSTPFTDNVIFMIFPQDGGTLICNNMAYPILDGSVAYLVSVAHIAEGGNIQPNMPEFCFGYSKSNMEQGENGEVRIIGSVNIDEYADLKR